MMDRLRSPLRTLAVIASLVPALTLAGLGASQARPSSSPQSAYVNEQPCHDICRAYLDWSRRVMAKLRPSPPVKKTAAQPGRPPRAMVYRAPGTRRPALNSFAQWPARSAATKASMEAPPAAAMPQAEAAPSRQRDEIADEFPATRELLTAMRAYSSGAARVAAGTTVGAAIGSTSAGQGSGQGNGQGSGQASGTVDAVVGALDIGLAALLLFAFLTLPALLLLWRRSRRDAEHQRLSDPGQMNLAPEFGPLT
jgi:hypothetical protein